MNLEQLVKGTPTSLEFTRDTLMAPFQQRKDHPWVQSTARNLGHAVVGEDTGNYLDNKLLGDFNGYRYQSHVPQEQQPFQQTGQMTMPSMQNPWLDLFKSFNFQPRQ